MSEQSLESAVVNPHAPHAPDPTPVNLTPAPPAGWFAGLRSVKWGAVLIEDGALSLGRVMGWLVFAGLLYLWMVKVQEPPMSMVETFWALLVYNANKKVVGPLTTFFQGRRPGGASVTQAAVPWTAAQAAPVQAAPAPASLPGPQVLPQAAALRKASPSQASPPHAPAGIPVTEVGDPWAED
jgi:hypothetical protein